MPALVKSFDPGLPPRAWLLQAGVLINFLGNGMVAPFLVIYLHFGRGIPVALAGAAVALGGITAVTSGLIAGWLADRVGPRNVLVVAMALNAGAYLAYTQVTAPAQAFAVGLLVGVGTGAYGPSAQSLLAFLVPPEIRQAAFAQNRVTSVVGLGLGGTIGGVVASAGLPGYVRLLQLDALTFLVFAGLVMTLPRGRAAAKAPSSGGYADVIRDRAFVRLVAVNVALVAAGIAPMLVLLPAFAKGQAHVAELAIGTIYAANTLTIALVQLPLTRATRSLNRMKVLRIGALIWMCSWLVCAGAGAWLSAGAAAFVIGAAAVAYAVGECLYSSIMLPTATALAPESLRGRHLGAMGLAWQGGFLLGPSLGSLALGIFPLALPLLCACGCIAAASGTRAVDRALAPQLRVGAVTGAVA
ncbi:MAG TPA: MFS transporter [Candidatus Dormibacteraeota bacterium]|nr:MFS transporter [Candidatus Dormibacteraeota bacterium]